MEIATHPEFGPPGHKLRAGKTRCTARFTRVNEPDMSAADQVRAAERDVRFILDLAAQRWNLGQYPDLPIAQDVAAIMKLAAAEDREFVTFIKGLHGRLTKRQLRPVLDSMHDGVSRDAIHLLTGLLIEEQVELTEVEQHFWTKLNQPRATVGKPTIRRWPVVPVTPGCSGGALPASLLCLLQPESLVSKHGWRIPRRPHPRIAGRFQPADFV